MHWTRWNHLQSVNHRGERGIGSEPFVVIPGPFQVQPRHSSWLFDPRWHDGDLKQPKGLPKPLNLWPSRHLRSTLFIGSPLRLLRLLFFLSTRDVKRTRMSYSVVCMSFTTIPKISLVQGSIAGCFYFVIKRGFCNPHIYIHTRMCVYGTEQFHFMSYKL